MDIPEFADKQELFDFLHAHKAELIAEKKYKVKEADSISCAPLSHVSKAEKVEGDPNTLQVKSVINTTKVMDSHSDVHIDGLWTKSLQENKGFYLLQEHQMKFDMIISDIDQVKAGVQNLSWSLLGYPSFKGTTQALVFDSTINKDRNEFMFDQYKKGFVKNHSVGMRYVKLFLAMNSENPNYSSEKETWDKYIGQVVNRKEAEAQGFFWAVTEAKIIEGSAVVRGSNIVTPVLSTESKEDTGVDGSHSGTQEPSFDTLKKRMFI